MKRGVISNCSKRKNGKKAPAGSRIEPASRPSLLGNPFPVIGGKWTAESEKAAQEITGLDSEMDKAISAARGKGFAQGWAARAHALWLWQQFRKDNAVTKRIKEIAEEVRQGGNVSFECWCAPKVCHTDNLIEAVEMILRGENPATAGKKQQQKTQQNKKENL